MTTDRETLYRGVSHAAWGYFFLYIDINLGSLNILPDWAAYALFLSAIGKLQGERRDLGLLRPLGLLLAVWNSADWSLALFGGSVSGHFSPLDQVVGVIQMYFHFQLLTDCAALAADWEASGETVDRRILRWRTIQTVIQTGVMCLSYLPAEWDTAVMTAMTAMVLVYLAAGLGTMLALFALRRLFREGTAVDPA